MKERIQKVLANAGVASRRSVEQMVIDGRITVNGKVMRDLPILIDATRDKIVVDGEKLKLVEKKGGGSHDETPGGPRIYLLLNKPKGYYSTNVTQGAQESVLELLPDNLPGRVYPVGRLDVETKGLLLMTNDGDLTNRLTHPRYGIVKTYRATVDGSIADRTIAEMEQGVWLTDPRTLKAAKSGKVQVKIVKRLRERSVIDITLNEGRNVQIRRLLAKLGHKVRDLVRTTIGPLTLDGMKTGHFRVLSPKELKALRQATARPEDETTGKPRGKSFGKPPGKAKPQTKTPLILDVTPPEEDDDLDDDDDIESDE